MISKTDLGDMPQAIVFLVPEAAAGLWLDSCCADGRCHTHVQLSPLRPTVPTTPLTVCGHQPVQQWSLWL